MNSYGIPKGPTRKQLKARRDRQEKAVKAAVRPQLVERDGYCRLAGIEMFGPCRGPSEWAHWRSRQKTRGLDPEERHNTATSMMLCDGHHDAMDGQQLGASKQRLYADPLTDRGCDGPMRWTQGEKVYEEEER